MRIGEEVRVRGIVDEIRKDVVIIKNKGGYFGTVPEEIEETEQETKACVTCKHFAGSYFSDQNGAGVICESPHFILTGVFGRSHTFHLGRKAEEPTDCEYWELREEDDGDE